MIFKEEEVACLCRRQTRAAVATDTLLKKLQVPRVGTWWLRLQLEKHGSSGSHGWVEALAGSAEEGAEHQVVAAMS